MKFSVITNTENVMDTSQHSGIIPVLDGIRVFSTLWVVLGHSYQFVRSVSGKL